MDNELRDDIASWLLDIGVNSQPSDSVATSILLMVSFIVATIAYYITKKVFVKAVNAMIRKSTVTWDDIFMRYGVLEKLSLLVPIMTLDLLIPIILTHQQLLGSVIDRGLSVLVVIFVIRAIYACLDAVNEIADVRLISRRLPVKSFVQLFKLFLFFVGFIIGISVIADESPIYFLSGLGVATGLVMLVFRDTILGFVAGIQLAANRMVSKGDWIQMDKYGADGAVDEVSLNTVKVRNWDNTITMIPAYALVSDAFKNWRGMSEKGGRRIKRSINLDVNSIHFLTEDDITRLSKVNYLKDYFPKVCSEISHANEQVSDIDMPVNGRRLTNVGTFRAYLDAYLRQNNKLHKDMTLMVRQLAPTPEGLPIELYVFTNDVRWAFYEGIQADIFDHVFAILPEFGLRAFQSPTGDDIRSIKPH
ncbi:MULTISPECIES: mechanosensitive ion channel domain-containing protein [unclassified Shewanella]|uniref:mechanosensitive ion channel family protein n=1 Tax=unclassified Shewanella TaxID=196818 RepID=UPI000C841E31|nr:MULTISPECIES: mechanosensitive ion channel domain-containing protein [unclassified Shewanella]MDO6619674.1 mechanosensitive ion channel [Shewanella sp. 6_MG-2023]MDO6678762.1 mechanosensitive ion channel [Shewanella sp. 4_MG-2023]MDO6775778.1 mechanosensitive ion channel [Shewanella sp. 3_MG-2023]PMG29162.1 mechanosensitive ion channel protein MscS [Shewanella sp. 10N.286.52.C2]PMG42611.1 mechanosensitive ion channel protein MscS [Shewanella sp. 10N.286.52.B9]